MKIMRMASVVPILLIVLFAGMLISIPGFAQKAEDTTDGRFHDDLLNHLVGKWEVSSVAHGSEFNSVMDVKWVLNHQFLHSHLKSKEIIPWWHVQMEYDVYFGYNHYRKRYFWHGVSIEGDEDRSEGFGYGTRSGNEFKTVAKFSQDSLCVQRYTWDPVSGSWDIASIWEIGGKEGEVFLDLKLTAIKPKAVKDKSIKL